MLSDRYLSFFCLLRPWVFKNFLIFALDRPFRVFTLESCFFFFFSFFFIFRLSYYALKNSSRTGEWFIKNFGWGKETTALLITKISQGRLSSVQVSMFDQNGLFRYVMWARVHGLKERINMPKLCFGVILTKNHFMKDHFSLSFHSSLSSHFF